MNKYKAALAAARKAPLAPCECGATPEIQQQCPRGPWGAHGTPIWSVVCPECGAEGQRTGSGETRAKMLWNEGRKEVVR
jgi:hypothetical protein